MRSLNPRQERFCHAFVYWANATHAAHDAGYASPSSKKQGYRLLKTARIRDRIREIQAGLSRDHGCDPDTLIGKLENVYRRAVEDHHFYAAVRAIEAQARLAGMTAARRRGAVDPGRGLLRTRPLVIEGKAEAVAGGDGPTPLPTVPQGAPARGH